MRRGVLVGVLALALIAGACGDDASSTRGDDQISAWLVQTCSADPIVRAEAVKALSTAWPESARAVPVLAEALDDEDAAVRSAAAASLDALAHRGVDPILAFLNDEEDPERRGLLKAFGTIQSLGAKVAPKDIAGGMTVDPRGGLVLMGLGMGVQRDNLSASHANRFLLAYLGACAEPARRSALGIHDPKWPETAAAVCAFAGVLALGPAEDRDVPAGILAVLDADDEALAGLGSMMRSTWSGTGPLGMRGNRLSSGGILFESALRDLGRIQPDDPFGPNPSEVPILIAEVGRLVPTLDATQRRQIAEALHGASERTDKGWVRRSWIRLLGRLGEEASVAVPKLLRNLEELETRWQGYMTEGGDDARPGDVVALQVEFGARFQVTCENRLFLADALGAIGPAAKEAVPLLERLVTEGDPTLAYLAARSLRRIRAD